MLPARRWLDRLAAPTITETRVGEWSDYFEDFPEENPANRDKPGVMQDLEQRLQPTGGGRTPSEVKREMFRMRDEAVKRAEAERAEKAGT